MVNPELFHIGPLTIYSYGLMLGLAFLAASYVLTKEVERKGLSQSVATEVTILALVGGLVGSKLFSLIENWNRFLENPIDEAFSPGGLTFYGGLILATLLITIYLRYRKISWFYLADATAPAISIGYGIGRIGCHLSGDGCYGMPCDLGWCVDYSSGAVKPTDAFSKPHLQEMFPNITDHTLLHPTPLYESIVAIGIFILLWKLRKKPWADGRLFALFLILNGTARFLVEFIRLNPRILWGLSEAQVIGAMIAGTGLILTFYLKANSDKYHYQPPKPAVEKTESPSKKKKGKKER